MASATLLVASCFCLLAAAAAVPLSSTLAAHAAVLRGDEPKPHWPTQFSVSFNETTRLLGTRNTTGTWWYDFEQQAELTFRANGRGDRYCGSIHPFTDTPCSHLVVNGARYLVFSELDQCCKCCTSAGGCGVLSPDWLQGAAYGGEQQLRGMAVHKWTAKGLQDNIYYATADGERVPFELDQLPNDLQSFDVATFERGPVKPTVFELPGNCAGRCPLLSVCSLLH